VWVFDPAGKEVGQFVAPLRRPSYSKDEFAAARTAALDAASSSAAEARITAIYRKAADLDHLPVFRKFTPGPNDELWIEQFEIRDSAPTPVAILNRSGAQIGTVRLPARAELLEAGTDYVLLLERDQDGVEYVTLYHLQRQ
jgi:hypothetical protein